MRGRGMPSQVGANAMRHSDTEPADQGRLQLPRDPRSAGEARRFVERLLREGDVPEDTRELAMLVSSELVTNAYKHGEGQIELRVNVLQDRLRIEVIDQGRRQAPAVREQSADQIGGWGLQIVDQLALQWGVFEGTTHVWADLTLG
jgi:anti-sigma regulatory factor (Ser/Thr protein kinase)